MKIQRLNNLFVRCILALVFAAVYGPTLLYAQATDSVAVVQQWLNAFNAYNAGDANKLVSDAFEMKIVYGKPDDPVFNGKKGLGDLVDAVRNDKFILTLTDLKAEGNRIKGNYSGLGDDLRHVNVGPEIGTVEATVENGLIKSLIFNVNPDFVRKYDAASAALKTVPTTGDEHSPLLLLVVALSGLALAGIGLSIRRRALRSS